MTQPKKESEATFQGFYKTEAFVLTKEMQSFGDFISSVVKILSAQINFNRVLAVTTLCG